MPPTAFALARRAYQPSAYFKAPRVQTHSKKQSRLFATRGEEFRKNAEEELPCYALSQRPTGWRLSTWSQITLITAVMGTARIRPIGPQSQPQKSSATVSASALRRTRQPTSAG